MVEAKEAANQGVLCQQHQEVKDFVDNREGGPLTQRQWKEARKFLARHPASGRVMSPDEARRAHLCSGMLSGRSSSSYPG